MAANIRGSHKFSIRASSNLPFVMPWQFMTLVGVVRHSSRRFTGHVHAALKVHGGADQRVVHVDVSDLGNGTFRRERQVVVTLL